MVEVGVVRVCPNQLQNIVIFECLVNSEYISMEDKPSGLPDGAKLQSDFSTILEWQYIYIFNKNCKFIWKTPMTILSSFRMAINLITILQLDKIVIEA